MECDLANNERDLVVKKDSLYMDKNENVEWYNINNNNNIDRNGILLWNLVDS